MERKSGMAVGFTMFAAIMLTINGSFQIIAGLTGIFENEFYTVTPNYFLKFDASAWGWIHLIWGVLRAHRWARRPLWIAVGANPGSHRGSWKHAHQLRLHPRLSDLVDRGDRDRCHRDLGVDQRTGGTSSTNSTSGYSGPVAIGVPLMKSLPEQRMMPDQVVVT